MTILGGAWIFLAFLIIMVVVLIWTVYSRTGSGINQRTYSRRYGDAPGARSDRVSGKEGLATMSTRGTKKR